MKDREQRGTVGSFIGSMINPIDTIKSQYFSAFAVLPFMGPYSQMYRTGSAQLSAIWIPVISNIKWTGKTTGSKVAKYIFSTINTGGYGEIPDVMKKALEDQFKNKIYGISTKGATGAGKGVMVGGAAEVEIGGIERTTYEAIMKKITPSETTDKALAGLYKEFKNKNVMNTIGKGGFFDRTMKVFNMNEAERDILGGAAKAAVNSSFLTTQAIGRIGTAATWMGVGLMVGEGAMWLAGTAFKAQQSLVKYAESMRQHARMINFGGSLQPGYMTQGAFTERQRLVQEMQRSPLAGRRMMGNEASIYHGML